MNDINNKFYSKDNGIYFEQTKDLKVKELNIFLKKYLKNNRKALDLGCGSGREMRFLESLGSNVIGIDSTKIFIDKCKLDNLQVYNSILPKIEIEEKEFDLIYSIATIFHLNKIDRLSLFTNINKILKADGGLVLSYNDQDRTKYKERFFDKIDGNVIIEETTKAGFKLIDREIMKDASNRFEWITDCYQKI